MDRGLGTRKIRRSFLPKLGELDTWMYDLVRVFAPRVRWGVGLDMKILLERVY